MQSRLPKITWGLVDLRTLFLAAICEIADYLPNYSLSNLPFFLTHRTPFCLEQFCAQLQMLTFPDSLAAILW